MKVSLNTNESGFTLLETIISLFISSLILLLLHGTVLQLNKMNKVLIEDSQTISTSKSKIYGNRQIEWHLFLSQLEHYLVDTELVRYNSKEIVVSEKNKEDNSFQKIYYGQALTGNRNFYRNNNNGYNEMLSNIKDYRIDISGNCLMLFFTFQNEEKYEGRIWIKSWK